MVLHDDVSVNIKYVALTVIFLLVLMFKIYNGA